MAKYLLIKHYRGAPTAVNNVRMDQWTPAEVEACRAVHRHGLIVGDVELRELVPHALSVLVRRGADFASLLV